MSTSRKIYTGIGLDLDVVEFLADLGRETQRTRSWLINALIRDQFRRMEEEREAKVGALNRLAQPVIHM